MLAIQNVCSVQPQRGRAARSLSARSEGQRVHSLGPSDEAVENLIQSPTIAQLVEREALQLRARNVCSHTIPSEDVAPEKD